MTRGKSRLRPRKFVAWALLFAHFALCACTDPVERPAPVNASIDADGLVRGSTVTVEIVLQGLRRPAGGGSKIWDTIASPLFRPESDTEWPWRSTLTADESKYERYDLVAIARDSGRAPVGRVQVIRDLADARRSGLRARFDAACFRRDVPCEDGFTCVGGACVDATQISFAPAADGGTESPSRDGSAEVPDELKEGIATENAPCKTGQRACADHGSRTPLACEDGRWKVQPDCPEAERCNSAKGDTLGTCQAVIDQCANRRANVPFCDGETMRVCPDLVASLERMCFTNERCVATPSGEAECDCKAGFTMEGGRCTQPSKCGANNGGCDTLTTCTTEGDTRKCGACPSPGYTGTGDQGCLPQLLDLKLSAGTIAPAFASSVHEYGVRVPLIGQRVTLTPTVPANTMVTVNDEPLDERGAWTSPVLPFDKTSVRLEITSKFGVTSQYAFTLERTAEQAGYLESINPASLNQFGSAVSISGDTLVVTSWFDDSSAKGIDGDPKDTGATDSGAAYVYVRDGDAWKLQAYVKPSDTMTYDYFGTSVLIQGDTLVVGAIHQGLFDTFTNTSRPGAVYVFERKAGVWKQTQRLAAAMPNGPDFFGMTVALNGDTLVVGAPAESTGGSRSGAAYVFRRNGSMFEEVQNLKATKPIATGAFGSSVSLEGDRMVIGAPSVVPSSNPGTAETFIRDGGTWKSAQVLQQAIPGGSSFGYWTSLRGNRMAISAPRPSDYPGSPTPTDPGEVYVYELEGDAGNWKQTAVLTAPHPRQTNWFGLSLVLTENGIVICSPGDASGGRGLEADPERGSATFSGAVHLFAPTPQGWVESAFIKGDNTNQDDWFGSAVGIDKDSLVVSARFKDTGGYRVGAVYVFR